MMICLSRVVSWGQFLLERFVTSFVVMTSVALLTFMLIDLAPGSYVDELAANPQISPAALARMREQYGLDRPFYRKFWQWGQSVTRSSVVPVYRHTLC